MFNEGEKGFKCRNGFDGHFLGMEFCDGIFDENCFDFFSEFLVLNVNELC
jgi:hypothetical protein